MSNTGMHLAALMAMALGKATEVQQAQQNTAKEFPPPRTELNGTALSEFKGYMQMVAQRRK